MMEEQSEECKKLAKKLRRANRYKNWQKTEAVFHMNRDMTTHLIGASIWNRKQKKILKKMKDLNCVVDNNE